MKNILLLFILFVPAFLFAQYPATGNKQRLGYQTTGDGLIWRGVAGDTVNKPNNRNYPYFQLDTVNAVLYRFIQTRQQWQPVTGGADIDSLIYATRYWVNSNFFPLEGGTLTGTGGAGFIGFPSQISAPGTPASGLNVYAQGSSFNWKGTDGYERQITSTLTGGHSYDLPNVNGTFALGTGTADRSARWSATNTLATGNFTDNGTKVQALLPFQFQDYTTAGLPTGVTGYHVYNTTIGGTGWYDGSRWNYIPKAVKSAFTSTYVPFTNSNGQFDESANFSYDGNGLFIGGAAFTDPISSQTVRVGARSGSNLIWLQPNYTFGPIMGITDGTVKGILGFVSSSSVITGSVTNHPYVVRAGNNARMTYHVSSTADALNLSSTNIVTLPTSQPNSPMFSFTFGGAPYLAVTDGTVRAFGCHANATDGAVFGAYSNHVTTFRAGGNVNRLQIGTAGTLTQLNTTTGMFLASGTTAQTPTEAGGLIRFNSDSTLYQIFSGGSRGYIATRAYARGISFYGANGALTSNRTVSGGSFWLNFDSNTGIKQSSPTQELDVNGDAYIRDSTRIGTLPNQTTATKILSADASGWIGYRDASSFASNTIYTASDSISGDRYLEMANDGSAATALGYFPSFPDGGGSDFGLFVNPTNDWQEISLRYNTGNNRNTIGSSLTNIFINSSKSNDTRQGRVGLNQGGITLQSVGSTTTNKDWKVIIDSTKFEITRNISGTDRVYELLPNDEYPSTTSAAKTVLQWTGDGSNANPAFVEVKRDTTIYVTDADYNFGTAISSANVLLRYNRVFVYSKLTASATSDNQIILPSASTDFLQCSIYVFSNDASADADATSVDFTTNGAVDGAGGTLSSYALTGGQQILIRPTNDGGYKWFFN